VVSGPAPFEARRFAPGTQDDGTRLNKIAFAIRRGAKQDVVSSAQVSDYERLAGSEKTFAQES
jgi:hypothetical protein